MQYLRGDIRIPPNSGSPSTPAFSSEDKYSAFVTLTSRLLRKRPGAKVMGGYLR